jgi:uncharacterized protein (DUF302 family)
MTHVDETISSIVDGLVDQGPEIAVEVEREEALGEHNANQVLFGVTKPGGAQAAIPLSLTHFWG